MQIFEQEKGCGPEQLFFQYCSILVLVSVWIVICFLECWSLLSWMCQSTSHPAALVEQCCDNDCTISGFRKMFWNLIWLCVKFWSLVFLWEEFLKWCCSGFFLNCYWYYVMFPFSKCYKQASVVYFTSCVLQWTIKLA